MADDKWIADLQGAMTAQEAAKIVLERRLGAVRDRLPAAVFQAGDDVEHVHQLRVSTRRAAAALRTFAVCLPDRVHRRARKTLRAIRRSAGEARDWDVFLAELQTRVARATLRQRRGFDFLLGLAHGQRARAQESLHEAYEENAGNLARRIEEISESLAATSAAGSSLRDIARPMLTQMLAELEAAANGDLERYEALHQVRILGKKLRYAMEIFASCFGAAFKQKHYPAIVEMQDILGYANDSHVAVQRLNAIKSRLATREARSYAPAIDALLAFHEKRLPVQRRKFERWWQAWVKAGTEEAFAALIRAQ